MDEIIITAKSEMTKAIDVIRVDSEPVVPFPHLSNIFWLKPTGQK